MKRRKPANRTGKAIQMYLPREMLEAVGVYASSRKPPTTKTDVFKKAVKELLSREGFYQK